MPTSVTKPGRSGGDADPSMSPRQSESDAIAARLDRLPPTREIWRWVMLLALGGFFEIYEMALTAQMGPALTAAGIFAAGRHGLFGLPDFATFAFSTFAGIYLGCLLFGTIADRFGRRPVFTYALLCYSLATAIMASQGTVGGICFWRFVAGVGVGIEIVVIDCYTAELMPKGVRGRGFALSMAVQYTAVPVAGLLAVLLIPGRTLGLEGWRWLALVPAIGAVLVWWVRRRLPESPRWLAEHGRVEEADTIVTALEDAAVARGLVLRPPEAPAPIAPDGPSYSLWRKPIVGRMAMVAIGLSAGNIAYYGFSNWLPSMLAAQGASIKESVGYTAAINLVYPLAPLLFWLFADRIERKWQIVIGSVGSAIAGVVFAQQSAVAGWIAFGIVITVFNNLFAYGSHAYQSELFPTQVRARAVGFAYSFTRIAAAFSSYLFAWLLVAHGVPSVFAFIALCMLICVISFGVFGPRTLNRTAEDLPGANSVVLGNALS